MKKLIAVTAMLLLSACAGTHDGKDAMKCPDVGLVLNSDHLPIFEGAPAAENIKVDSYIQNYRGACTVSKDGTLIFALEMDIISRKTDKAGTMKSLRLPYFIAVLGADESILQKEGFWTKIDFDKNGSALNVDKHDVVIPLDASKNPADYKIAIGFQLTADQIAYNRGLLKGK